MVKYILFQRTAYARFARNKLLLIISKYWPKSFYEKVVEWEADKRKDQIKKLFQRDILADYEDIRNFLPETCEKILDIGCGVAGIDIFLHRHYGSSDRPDFYLLDKSEIDKRVHYNFEPKGSFYNSLDLARDFLTRNGLSNRQIHLLEATPQNTIDAPAGIDLVISLISWGFHYPVDTYLDRVYELMKDGGRLIIDLRPETDGQEKIKNKFRQVRKISDVKKTNRILAVK